MKQKQVKTFFAGSNTVKGFHSYYEHLPEKSEEIYILKGGPGTGKSTTIKNIGQAFLQQNTGIEFFRCSSDTSSLDGVRIPEIKTAIFDGTAPHSAEPSFPGLRGEIINLGQYWEKKKLKQNKSNLKQLFNEITQLFNKAYNRLKICYTFYQETEEKYQAKFKPNKKNSIIQEILREISSPNKPNKIGTKRHLFGSAITPSGYINLIPELSENISRLYLFQGKPDREISQIFHQIGELAVSNGANTLYLHSGYIPKKLEALFIFELDIALVRNYCLPDNLNYTKKFYFKPEDIKLPKAYENYLKKAINYLQQAKNKHTKLEEYYISAMNFAEVKKIETKLINQLIP